MAINDPNSVVLNVASYKVPGGVYDHGLQAQEGDLCRSCHQLQQALRAGRRLYPILSDEALVTQGLQVIRHPATMKVNSGFGQVDIVSAAMPECRDDRLRARRSTPKTRKQSIFVPRFRAVLYAFAVEGKENIYLGAWGCGAFRCNRYEVAEAMIDVLRSHEFRGVFSNVIFAVIGREDHDYPNWLAFNQIPHSLALTTRRLRNYSWLTTGSMDAPNTTVTSGGGVGASPEGSVAESAGNWQTNLLTEFQNEDRSLVRSVHTRDTSSLPDQQQDSNATLDTASSHRAAEASETADINTEDEVAPARSRVNTDTSIDWAGDEDQHDQNN